MDNDLDLEGMYQPSSEQADYEEPETSEDNQPQQQQQQDVDPDDPAVANPDAYQFVRKSLDRYQREQLEQLQQRQRIVSELAFSRATKMIGRPLDDVEISVLEGMIDGLGDVAPEVLKDEQGVKRMLVTAKYLAMAQREVGETAGPVSGSDDAEIVRSERLPRQLTEEDKEAWQHAKGLNPNLTLEEYLKFKKARFLTADELGINNNNNNKTESKS